MSLGVFNRTYRNVPSQHKPINLNPVARLGGTPKTTPGALDMYGNPIGNTPYNPPGSPKKYTKPKAPSNTPQPVPGSPTGGAAGAPGSLYNSPDANYIRNLPTGYTPEQELAMRNRIRETQTAQNRGATTQLREVLGQQGFGGSGMELSEMGNLLGRQGAAAQGALSNLDISNAQTDLMNRYGKAGLLNQLMGTGLDENKLGEMGRQFDTSQYNQMYRWGNEQDWNRKQDISAENKYDDQLRLMLQQLGLL